MAAETAGIFVVHEPGCCDEMCWDMDSYTTFRWLDRVFVAPQVTTRCAKQVKYMYVLLSDFFRFLLAYDISCARIFCIGLSCRDPCLDIFIETADNVPPTHFFATANKWLL